METGRMKDVDIETLSEIHRDHEEMEKSLGIPLEKNEPRFFSNYFKKPVAPERKKECGNSDISDSFSGIENPSESIHQKNNSSGVIRWAEENPILASITGAVIAGAAVMIFRHFRKADNRKSVKKRVQRKKNSEPVEEAITSHSNKSILVEKIQKSGYKDITREAIVIAGASALGGAIAGAALGDIGLLASIPFAIIGFKKRSLNVAMASIAMALANGYQSENPSGNMIQRVIERLRSFGGNLFNKIFPWKKDEEERKGYYKTMLGYIPITK